MAQIEAEKKRLEEKVIYNDDYVSAVFIFTRDTDGLIFTIPHSKLNWGTDGALTLKEIADQLRSAHKTIFVWEDSPLEGVIYEYGNHGDYWEEYGKTQGYA